MKQMATPTHLVARVPQIVARTFRVVDDTPERTRQRILKEFSELRNYSGGWQEISGGAIRPDSYQIIVVAWVHEDFVGLFPTVPAV